LQQVPVLLHFVKWVMCLLQFLESQLQQMQQQWQAFLVSQLLIWIQLDCRTLQKMR
jgi:hypothetical protein